MPPVVWYSWLPGTGYVIDFTRPHAGSYACRNALKPPHSYWMSPSASTAARSRLTSRSEVYFWRQDVDVPSPLLKEEAVGSQAWSPAAITTGSAVWAGVVTWASLLEADTLPAASRARTSYSYVVLGSTVMSA